MFIIVQFVQEHRWALIVGVVLGLVLGLIVGWVIWPVQWENASPGHLRSDFQEYYLLWLADQFAINRDQAWARERLGAEYWEEGTLVETLENLAGQHGGAEAVHLRALKELAEAPAPAPTGEPEEAEPAAGGGLWGSVATICGVTLVVLACVGAVIYLIRRIAARRVAPEAARPGVRVAREVVPAEDIAWGVDGPPLVQFVTSYVLGDDHYDPSFSIELENGEFMGECGVGVSETIGVGTPNKVTAFEVWLFDKSDIRTVTKVLMSEYAFNDDALRTKLAPKGEPVLAGPGKDLVLETQTLRVRARIAEVEYGAGDLLPNSFFGRLAMDLMVWVFPGEAPPLEGDAFAMPPAS